MATVKYRIDGNLLPIDIQMANGNYQILAKTVVAPAGDKCVIYDCYCVSLNNVQPNVTDIEYYIGKIRRIANLYEQGLTSKEIIKRMAEDHVNQHGRIIDNDLMMIVSALRRTLEAIEGECDGKQLILTALEVVLNTYVDKVFVTIYNQTPFGLQPQLVPMKQYMNNK